MTPAALVLIDLLIVAAFMCRIWSRANADHDRVEAWLRKARKTEALVLAENERWRRDLMRIHKDNL